MNEQDLDSKEAIIGMRKELSYNEMINDIVKILDENKEIILATSHNDRVTARTVSFTNDGLIIYFMSWDHNKKIRQIQKNPKIALCLNNLQIEGRAQILGYVNEEKNANILRIFKKKFSDLWISTFTRIKEMLMIKVNPTTLTKFENINRRFFLQTIKVVRKEAFQMRLEDKENPNFPY